MNNSFEDKDTTQLNSITQFNNEGIESELKIKCLVCGNNEFKVDMIQGVTKDFRDSDYDSYTPIQIGDENSWFSTKLHAHVCDSCGYVMIFTTDYSKIK